MTLQIKSRSLVKRLGQSLLSLSFNLGGMLAGSFLVLHMDVFLGIPWALLLFPGVLSIRGAIGGLFCGRLSTGLHLGTVRASYRNNTRRFHLLFCAIVTLTFLSSIILGLATSFLSAITLGTTFMDSLAMLSVIVTTMGLSLLIISPITVGVSILSFKKGLDPDIIVYPVISTIADVLVTICYLFVLTGLLSSGGGQIVMGLVTLISIIMIGYLILKNYGEFNFRRTVKEFLFTLIVVAFIVNLTGVALEKISHFVRDDSKLYLVYPALIDTVGDVGSIVGSTITTKLALGTVERSFSSIKHHLGEISGAWIASVILFTIYTITSSVVYGLAVHDCLRFMVQLLFTNIVAVSLIVVISFGVAIYSMGRGWDPDNFVIPIESSLADSITTISLLTSLLLIS
jgi:mgtE-like transporter